MARILSGFVLAATVSLAGCGNSKGALPEAEQARAGPWALVAEDSGITFITTKLGDVTEIATFRDIEGSVSEAGDAVITIDLASIDTNNDIRDPRMREHLFETETYPVATASAEIDLESLESLEIGARHTEEVELTIDLHGVQDTLPFYMMVTRLGPNRVLVENKAPLILHAADFDMDGGVEKLRELAQLTEITPVVPVTFSFVFER